MEDEDDLINHQKKIFRTAGDLKKEDSEYIQNIVNDSYADNGEDNKKNKLLRIFEGSSPDMTPVEKPEPFERAEMIEGIDNPVYIQETPWRDTKLSGEESVRSLEDRV